MTVVSGEQTADKGNWSKLLIKENFALESLLITFSSKASL